MDPVRISSLGAIFCSIITIAAIVAFVPMLYAEINDVWAEIDQEMAEFKANLFIFYFKINSKFSCDANQLSIRT